MDGTLVDTEPLWFAAEGAMVARFGGEWTAELAHRMVGLALMDGARVLQEHGVDLPAEEIVEEMLDHVVAGLADGVVWQPGARELLAELAAAGVPCALVTMSFRRFVDAVVAQAPAGAFAVVVAGDDVTVGKPDPEPYLHAARILGVDPADCVAIEDSPPGITAALASGARTLGVEHIVAVELRPSLSRVPSLAGVHLADLERIAAGYDLDLLADPA
jgi:HAD superfamily hydrolase (TIGR01509 family)